MPQGLRRLLPRAREPILLATVVMLAAGCLAQAAAWLWNALAHQQGWALAGVAFWSALGAGLWRLHPVARRVAVVTLWALIVVAVLGSFSPFHAGDMMAGGGTAPTVLEIAAWLAPAIILALLALHVLGKYKASFGA